MDRLDSRLTRRQFVVGASAGGLGLMAGCGRLPWQAQAPQPGKVPRIGVLSTGSRGPSYLAFLDGLRELGYVDGQNVVLDVQTYGAQWEALPELATALASAPVDIIVWTGEP